MKTYEVPSELYQLTKINFSHKFMYISEIVDLIQIHSHAKNALTRLKKHVGGQ
jgi:hypothetical protein